MASVQKRVGRALTKYVRNFTGTITRTQDGQVVIVGSGPKPQGAKSLAMRQNGTRRNVEMGFHDSAGRFHPIRASSDYNVVKGGDVASSSAASLAAHARRKRRTKSNVEMGFWRGGVFHPIRASEDYEPDTVGERHQYAPKRKARKKTATKRKR